MSAVEAVTGLGGLVAMIHGGIVYSRVRARRPRLCACGHGSGMHHIERGCRGRVERHDAEGIVTSDRPCGCGMYDGQGRRVR